MKLDYETGNFIGAGEDSVFIILQNYTHLKYRSLKHFPLLNGIYRQIPIQWIIPQKEFDELSQAHKNGSIDLFILYCNNKIAIRVQGQNHGMGLKGIGKAQHDKVQKSILENNGCKVVDILYSECKELFKNRTNNKAIKELTDSFKTNNIEIPTGIIN